MTITQRVTTGLGVVAVSAVLGAVVIAQAQNAPDTSTDRADRPFMSRRAGPEGPRGPRGPGLSLAGLGLTDAQRESVRGIAESREAEMTATADRARSAREALRASTDADPFDEAAIRTRSAELAVVQADIAVARARQRSDVLAVLTPEQKSVLTMRESQQRERQANMAARRQDGPGFRGGRGPGAAPFAQAGRGPGPGGPGRQGGRRR